MLYSSGRTLTHTADAVIFLPSCNDPNLKAGLNLRLHLALLAPVN